MGRLSRFRKLQARTELMGVNVRNTVSSTSNPTQQPEDFTPDLPPALRPAFFDGWMGDSWRKRLFGTGACRVLIVGNRLVVLPLPL